ncbi:MAG: ATP-binding protein [Alphaproteobacteria bacterium]|nr:ATP-binding protein [Alphaproteobacteria bacterium]
MTVPILYLIHGYIGAGKTTFAKKLEAETNALRFTEDEWIVRLYGHNPDSSVFNDLEARVKALITDLAVNLLKNGQSVILDFGFWKRSERDFWRKTAKELGADVRLYNVSAPADEMKRRTVARTENGKGEELFIDENAFDTLLENFEPLQPDEEGWEISTGR